MKFIHLTCWLSNSWWWNLNSHWMLLFPCEIKILHNSQKLFFSQNMLWWEGLYIVKSHYSNGILSHFDSQCSWLRKRKKKIAISVIQIWLKSQIIHKSNIFNWVSKLQHSILHHKNLLWQWELDQLDHSFNLCNTYFYIKH